MAEDLRTASERADLLAVLPLHRLTRRQQAIIVLRHCLGWGVMEIAELLGVSQPSVSRSYARALRRLWRLLDASRGD